MALHTMAGLRALFKRGKPVSRGKTGRVPGRNVMMHVTLDAEHVTPLREALIRDCGDQPWTIRVAPLPDCGRVRLSLYVPKAEVNHAIQRVALLVPAAQMGRVLEIPDAPTDAWRDVMHAEFQPRAEAQARPAEAAAEAYSIATLLSQDDVLLGLNIADRPALFAELGHFFEQRCGLPATTTTAALAAREELGSTALGLGVALPHGHIQSLNRPMAAYVCPADPIAFDAPDGQPVKDIIVLLVPEWGNSMHLHLLADVAQRFCDHHFREQLHACADVRAVSELFRGYQAREQALEKPPAKAPETRARSFRTQR